MKKVIYGLIAALLVTFASPLFVAFAFSEVEYPESNVPAEYYLGATKVIENFLVMYIDDGIIDINGDLSYSIIGAYKVGQFDRKAILESNGSSMRSLLTDKFTYLYLVKVENASIPYWDFSFKLENNELLFIDGGESTSEFVDSFARFKSIFQTSEFDLIRTGTADAIFITDKNNNEVVFLSDKSKSQNGYRPADVIGYYQTLLKRNTVYDEAIEKLINEYGSLEKVPTSKIPVGGSTTRFDMRNFVPTKPDPVKDNIPKLPLVIIPIAFIGAVLLLSRKSITFFVSKFRRKL